MHVDPIQSTLQMAAREVPPPVEIPTNIQDLLNCIRQVQIAFGEKKALRSRVGSELRRMGVTDEMRSLVAQAEAGGFIHSGGHSGAEWLALGGTTWSQSVPRGRVERGNCGDQPLERRAAVESWSEGPPSHNVVNSAAEDLTTPRAFARASASSTPQTEAHSYASSRRLNTGILCHHCKRPGHVKARCPSMECRRCGEKGHMQFACPQEGPPEVDLSSLLKSMVLSKEEEESMRYNANKWADALAERDALERKMDRVMKELAEKKRAVQEWGKKIQSSITGTKRYTK